MRLLTARLHAPLLRQRLSLGVHSQGRPTAFEKMAVSIVKTGRGAEDLKGQSIPALFELLIGNDAADHFLDDALSRLFSPTTAILGVGSDVRFSSYRDIPVSEIEILPNGEELLRTGFFPTQSRTFYRTVIFNPLSGTVEVASDADIDLYPEDASRALPESLATSAWSEEATEELVKKKFLRPGDVLSGISREESGTVGWTTFTASLELEDGALRAASAWPGAADYLNGLPPDDFRRLMLSGLEIFNVPGPARQLDDIDPADLFPAGAALDAADPEDRQTFSHVVMARAFFAQTPMEIPIGIRERLPGEAAAAMTAAAGKKGEG